MTSVVMSNRTKNTCARQLTYFSDRLRPTTSWVNGAPPRAADQDSSSDRMFALAVLALERKHAAVGECGPRLASGLGTTGKSSYFT